MKLDLNSLRPDHPLFAGAAGTAQAEAYEGDFSSTGFDANKHMGLIFPDGNYTVPPELKISALSIGAFLLEKEASNIQKLLPGLGLRDGEPIKEHVASYLLALSGRYIPPIQSRSCAQSAQIWTTARG